MNSNMQAVHILLECILVVESFASQQRSVNLCGLLDNKGMDKKLYFNVGICANFKEREKKRKNK